jgi:hypothetical protein
MLTILGVLILVLAVVGFILILRNPMSTVLTVVVSIALVTITLLGIALLTGWRPLL